MLSVVRGWGSFEWWWQYVYDVIDSQVNHADNGDSGAGDVFRVAVHVGRCAEPTGVCAQGAEEMADWLDMSAGEVVAHLRSLEELAVVSAYAPGAGGWCPAGIESADPDRVLVCHTPPVGADTDEADERGVQVPAVLVSAVCGEVARHFARTRRCRWRAGLTTAIIPVSACRCSSVVRAVSIIGGCCARGVRR